MASHNSKHQHWPDHFMPGSTRFAIPAAHTGEDPQAAGYWLLVTCCWLLVAGCWFVVTGYWSLDAGCWSLAAGYWLLAAGCSLLATVDWRLLKGPLDASCWLSWTTGCGLVAGYSGMWLAVGCWLLAAGYWLLAAGCWLLDTLTEAFWGGHPDRGLLGRTP